MKRKIMNTLFVTLLACATCGCSIHSKDTRGFNTEQIIDQNEEPEGVTTEVLPDKTEGNNVTAHQQEDNTDSIETVLSNEAQEVERDNVINYKVDSQSFEVELNKWGEVEFISCLPTYDENMNPLTDASFYLFKDNEILYHFPNISEDNIRETGIFNDISFVMFSDSNNDGKKDVIIGLTYISGAGPQGMIPYTEVRVYEDFDTEFVYNSTLCNYINATIPSDANADDIRKLLTE